MLMLLFTNLIVWLEAFAFIKLYGLYSLMKHCKCIIWEDTSDHDECAVDDQL